MPPYGVRFVSEKRATTGRPYGRQMAPCDVDALRQRRRELTPPRKSAECFLHNVRTSRRQLPESFERNQGETFPKNILL